jgi:NAD(P)-dependent dehydrogenase (short-subunit alcohol dehydrogenase family)
MANGKTALVVGASRGLGLGFTRELVDRGWGVIATARKPASAEELGHLARLGKVEIETLDVNDVDGLARLKDHLAGRRLDLLLVNAGIAGPTGDELRAPAADIAELFLTNSVAPIRIADTLKYEVNDGGVIGFITSGLGSVGQPMGPGFILYKGSKAALNVMTRTFTAELARPSITVLSISPGWVRTDMGGPDAPLSVEQSAKGVVDLIEAKAGTGEHGFYGMRGETIPW